MTMLMEPARDLLIDVVRGDPARRPRCDVDSAGGLRALLEDEVYAILGAGPWAHEVVISSADIHHEGRVLEHRDSPLSRARGILISTSFRLLVAHVHIDNPYGDALAAWRSEHPHDELLDVLDHLEADQVARLRADVAAHFDTLARRLGPIPSSWRPRTSQRARQLLGGARVRLSDVVDLVVGSTHHEYANVALVDITTSPLSEGAERVMRYHALMQTLRTSVVPLRTSIFSSATGELWTLDVDPELLIRAVGDVVQTLRRLAVA